MILPIIRQDISKNMVSIVPIIVVNAVTISASLLPFLVTGIMIRLPKIAHNGIIPDITELNISELAITYLL